MKLNIQIYNCKYSDSDVIDSATNLHGGIATMLSRFFPMFDSNVKKFITIEADNWPTSIYFDLIEKWDKSDKLCITFLSASPYGWPSGNVINHDGIDKIVTFAL